MPNPDVMGESLDSGINSGLVPPALFSPHRLSLPPTLHLSVTTDHTLSTTMSRYLAFVLLALSATSVLAAPADLPPLALPDVTEIIPVVGRSNNKVYSPNTLLKRDWESPASTRDCRMSEVPEDATTLSYTHDGVEYSEECLTRLALSVPFEDRKSCRTTGHDAHGYDEECLYKKAFDEDWKFDLEKAERDELAWRAAHPTVPSSDHWRTHYPNSAADCLFSLELDGELKIVEGDKEKEEKEKGKRDGEKKGEKKASDELDGWKPYSVAPNGDKYDDECAVRLVIRLKLVIDIGKCPAHHDSDTKSKPHSLSEVAPPTEKHGFPLLNGRSSTELATRADSESLKIKLSALVALRLGCLLGIMVDISLKVGLHVKLLDDIVGDGATDGIIGTILGLLSHDAKKDKKKEGKE